LEIHEARISQKLKFNLLSFLPNPNQESAGVFQEKAHSLAPRECWKFNEKVKSVAFRACWSLVRNIKSVLEVPRLKTSHQNAPKAFSTSQEQVRRLASKERWQFQEEVKSVAPREAPRES
jgi:hypothetical protein